MDTVTHALLGALSVQAIRPRQGRVGTYGRLIIGAAAGAFPDIDFLAFPVNPLRFLADWHQGITHSIVMLPLWAMAAAVIHAWFTGRRDATAEAAGIAAVALFSHIAADLVTAYGTRILAPFSDWRPSLSLVFLVDPLITGIVGLALIPAVTNRHACLSSRGIAALGLAACAGYLIWQAELKRQATELAAAAARGLAVQADEIAVLPQPFSPFNWTLVVRHGEVYYRAHVNLVGHAPTVLEVIGLERLRDIAASYRSRDDMHWERRHRFGETPEQRRLAAQLWHRADFEPYRRFAALPGISRFDRRDGETCVWFTDLRYDLPKLPDTFRFGYCRAGPAEAWRLHRLRYLTRDSREAL